MTNTERLTEYSISGGMFWLALFAFVTVTQLPSGGDALQGVITLWESWIKALAGTLAPLADAGDVIKTALSTILGVLGIIMIFCTGILLDLFSAVFFAFPEMRHFKRWLSRNNSDWMSQLCKENEVYIGSAFYQFTHEPLLDPKDPWQFFRQRQRYIKLRSFLVSFILLKANEAHTTDLMNQLHLWRQSRAIAAAIVTMGVALNFATPNNWLAMMIPAVLFFISYAIAIGMFARVNVTMCSMAYLLNKRP